MIEIFTQEYSYWNTENNVERKTFADGERYIRLPDVKNQEVVIYGGTINDSATLDIFRMGCAAVKYGATKLTLVIPYFGYARMERAVKSGEVVVAKTQARLLSAIPKAPLGNHIIMMDLHADGITHYFEDSVFSQHVYGKEVVLEAIKEFGGDNYVLGSSDSGRSKWVESLACELGVQPAFVYKKRIDGEHTEVTGIDADVNGKTVVIYDDLAMTGGTLINAANAYREKGAIKVFAVCSHGVLPNNSIFKIERFLDGMACTDSHPNALAAQKLAPTFLKIKTVLPTLKKYL